MLVLASFSWLDTILSTEFSSSLSSIIINDDDDDEEKRFFSIDFAFLSAFPLNPLNGTYELDSTSPIEGFGLKEGL